MSFNAVQPLSVLYFADPLDAECRDHQLARAGYLVDRAFTFIRAASLAESRAYSILLIGQVFPAEMRIRIAQMVRAENPHALVVLLCSAPVAASECEAVLGPSAGAHQLDAVLPADVEGQQLASMLLQLLMSKASRRAREARAS